MNNLISFVNQLKFKQVHLHFLHMKHFGFLVFLKIITMEIIIKVITIKAVNAKNNPLTNA